MSLPLLHPAIIHFPIAFLIAASLAGLVHIYWRPLEPLRILTWWSMAAGWLTLIAAILTGIVDQGALPPEAPYRSLLNWHTTSGLVLALLYGDLLYRRWIYSSRGKRQSPRGPRKGKGNHIDKGQELRRELLAEPRQKWLLTVELLLGIGLVVLSGWLGGKMVYTWGVNVASP